MDAAMHTIIMAFLFQTYNIKILNANYIEARLIIIHGVVPAISFETDMTDLSTIHLGRCKSLEIRPKSIIHHLKNFGIDQIQLRILKLKIWNHVLSIISLELDAFLLGIIQVFEKPIIEPPASIQILC